MTPCMFFDKKIKLLILNITTRINPNLHITNVFSIQGFVLAWGSKKWHYIRVKGVGNKSKSKTSSNGVRSFMNEPLTIFLTKLCFTPFLCLLTHHSIGGVRDTRKSSFVLSICIFVTFLFFPNIGTGNTNSSSFSINGFSFIFVLKKSNSLFYYHTHISSLHTSKLRGIPG